MVAAEASVRLKVECGHAEQARGLRDDLLLHEGEHLRLVLCEILEPVRPGSQLWQIRIGHPEGAVAHARAVAVFLVGAAGEQTGVRIPVSRDRAQVVREALLSRTMGIRPR